jgi:hypothetical protein
MRPRTSSAAASSGERSRGESCSLREAIDGRTIDRVVED